MPMVYLFAATGTSIAPSCLPTSHHTQGWMIYEISWHGGWAMGSFAGSATYLLGDLKPVSYLLLDSISRAEHMEMVITHRLL